MKPDDPSLMQRHVLLLVGLGILITLLNALKPLRMDDTYYFFFAQQIALLPLDPGGFELYLHEWPERASDRLVPPLLIYWLAGAIKLFGSQPALWKLSMLPFALILVFSLHVLFRRFAPGAELPLTCFIILSPAIIPGFNLMQDIPAEALIFASLAAFILACEKQRMWLGILAGLLAGLAMLTKYTGIVAPAAIMLYALFFGRVRHAILACGLSAIIFLSWEFATYLMYGRSQFLFTLNNSFLDPWSKLRLAEALLKTLGAIHVAIVLLALTAWSAPRWLLAAIAGIALAGYGIIAFQPAEHIVFSVYGIAAVMAIAAVCIKLLRPPGQSAWWRTLLLERRQACFLVSLLLLEIVAYFIISPFGAVRRLIGLTVVSTLLVSYLVSRNLSLPGTARVLWGVAAFNITLGLGFYALDMREAQVFKQGAQRTASVLENHTSGRTVWYHARWGFQFYAEQEGMRPLVPEHSQVKAGDWIVYPNIGGAWVPSMPFDSLRLVNRIIIDDPLNLTTQWRYYSGVVPLEHRNRPRMLVSLWLATSGFTPRTGLDTESVVAWVRNHQNTSSTAMPLPRLIRDLGHQDSRYRYLSAEALGILGPRAVEARRELQTALRDPDPSVRKAASRALEKIDAKKM